MKYSVKKLYFFLPGFKNEQKISQGGLNVEMNNARDKEFFTFSNEISNCKRDCGRFILYWGFNLDRNWPQLYKTYQTYFEQCIKAKNSRLRHNTPRFYRKRKIKTRMFLFKFILGSSSVAVVFGQRSSSRSDHPAARRFYQMTAMMYHYNEVWHIGII